MKRILLISGSLRSSSINTAVLRTAAQGPASDVVGCLYDRLELLPAFNPDRDRDPMEREVRFLRDEIHEAGALLFSTPEYAGALPGALKNLLDWIIGDDQVGSIYGKPVGWINASARGAAGAYGELRTVLGYAHASIVECAFILLPVTPDMVGAEGIVTEPALRRKCEVVLPEIAGAATDIPKACPAEWIRPADADQPQVQASPITKY
jgi:chromate reductase, NAD(P)H dehydrogenase (quinone)